MPLSSPLQSWGGDATSYASRPTENIPTLSAVLGILCSCMGISFRNDLEADAGLRDSLKVDIYVHRKGSLLRDFQGAGGGIGKEHSNFYERCLPPKGGTAGMGRNKIYTKEYLQGASFDIVLRIDNEDLVAKIVEALKRPAWEPFLGRRANHLSELPFGGLYDSKDDLKDVWEKEGRSHSACFIHSDTGVPIKDLPLCRGDNYNGYRYAQECDLRDKEYECL